MRRIALLLSIVLLAGALPATAQSPTPEHYRMRAIVEGNVGAGTRYEVEVMIERWAEEGAREQVLTALAESGPEAMKSALQALPEVGWVRVNTRLSYPLQFSVEYPQADGTRIIRLVTDRPIRFGEAMSQSRTADEYVFSVVELTVDAEGNGEGVAIVGAKLNVDAEKRTFSLESYDGGFKLATVHAVR